MTNIIEYVTTGMGDGGAETLIKDYALLLDRSQFNVTVVTINPPVKTSANYARLKEAGIEIVPIYKRPKVFKTWVAQKIWNRFFHKKYVGKRLLQIICDRNVQVLHCHLEVLYTLQPISRKLGGLKILFTCHNQPKIIFQPTRWESEEKAARNLIAHNNLRMIALHDNMRIELNERFGVQNTVVIHNGIDFDKFLDVTESKEEIRKTIGLESEKYVVGHVGRFSEAKNHEFLVDVFSEMLKLRPNSHLLMVGAGDKQKMIEQKLQSMGLKDKYTILSHRTDIPRLLRAMDIFVFPSLYEGLPVSIVEAQVAGLRTIASDVITEECFFTENAVPLSIAEKPSHWATVILDESIKGKCRHDINAFNMKNEITRLEKLYEED